jgi:hypothetical protein
MTPTIGRIIRSAPDADALAWRAAVLAAGGAVAGPRLFQVSRVARDLKAAGVWAKLDRLWLLAAANTQSSLIDLVARGTGTATSSPTFTADRGWQGNGSSSFVDFDFNPTTATSPKFALNDASFGLWAVTASSVTAGVDVGNYTGGAVETFIMTNHNGSGTFSRYQINASAGAASVDNGGVTTGMFHAQRTASNAIALYINGASVGTAATASASVINRAFYVDGFGNAQAGAAWMGKGMTSGEIAAFYNAMRYYMTSVGVP